MEGVRLMEILIWVTLSAQILSLSRNTIESKLLFSQIAPLQNRPHILMYNVLSFEI
jgi:hypothetical protein